MTLNSKQTCLPAKKYNFRSQMLKADLKKIGYALMGEALIADLLLLVFQITQYMESNVDQNSTLKLKSN
jgi:hypothetical protein